MKVLFAVKDNILEHIKTKYRKLYQEILTYKNVYYFNAIVKELQKDKSYDRVIISEELEDFANNNYDTIDKFLFEKLDSVSDEANDSSNGKENSIILICSERRQKGDELLSKLFSIGIYNALIGDDRTYENVCKLIKNPRGKKEAKLYYKIDSETSGYRVEGENEVNEVEIQNILTHFRKLGKATEKYAQSFDNIAQQYTEDQLRVIANCLPNKVKIVLSQTSEKYKQLASTGFGLGVQEESQVQSSGTGIKVNMMDTGNTRNKITKPIVIPSNVKTSSKNKRVGLSSDTQENTTTAIKIKRKPESLQGQIERRKEEELEYQRALENKRKLEQAEKESLEQNKKVSKVNKEVENKETNIEDVEPEVDVFDNIDMEPAVTVGETENKQPDSKFENKVGTNNTTFADEDEDIPVNKENSSDVSDLLDDDDELFASDELLDDDLEEDVGIKDNTSDSKVSIDEDEEFDGILDDDLLDDVEDVVDEPAKPQASAPVVEDDEDDDLVADDDLLDDVEDVVSEPVKPQASAPVLEDDEDDDLFADDDLLDDVEEVVNEPVKPQAKAPVVEDDEDDDLFGDDDLLDDVEEVVSEPVKPQASAPVVEDDEEDDLFGDDDLLDDVEEVVSEPVKPQATAPVVEDDEDDDLFGDDDLLDDVEEVVNEPVKPQAKAPVVEDDEDDDLFGDDDLLDDVEEVVNEPVKPQAKAPVVEDEEDEDIFADDDLLDDVEEVVSEPVKPQAKSPVAEDDEDDDLFGDDDLLDDVEETVSIPQKPQAKSPVAEDDEDDDLFGDDDLLDDVEETVSIPQKPQAKAPIVEDDEDEDIFAEDDLLDDIEETVSIPQKPQAKAPIVEDDEDEDIFADDDLLDDIEETVSIPQKPQAKAPIVEDDEDEDIFADDDLLDDIEETVSIPQKPQAKAPIVEDEEDDDIFADDDLLDDIEETVSIPQKPQAKAPIVEDEEDDDIFADDLLDDIEETVNIPQKPQTKVERPNVSVNQTSGKTVNNPKVEKNVNPIEDSDEDDFDLFDEDNLSFPGLDELDELDDYNTPSKKGGNAPKSKVEENIEEDEDLFGSVDELDEDIFDTTKESKEISNKPVAEDDVVESIKPKVNYSTSNLNKLLTKEKKVVSFVGTSKNGVSFLVNNLAKLFSSIGINTAILDMTKNRNSYYVYVNDQDDLRKITYTSLDKLEQGYAEGIKVNKNLTVYTTIPSNEKTYSNAEQILSTLVQHHTLVLVDCDFDTDYSYFVLTQEMYLVQSMDILTLQPLINFLRKLQLENLLEPEKLRIVINKEIKISNSITPKSFIAAMSLYKNDDTSALVELFNRDMVQACSIPFEVNTYSKYLYAIAACDISLSGYSKVFMSKLKNLGEMIYPLNSRPSYSSNIPSQNFSNGNDTNFSNNMNSTLRKMKKKF